MIKQTQNGSTQVAPQRTPIHHVLSCVAATFLLIACTGCKLSITTNGLVYENPNFGGFGYQTKIKSGQLEESKTITTRGQVDSP